MSGRITAEAARVATAAQTAHQTAFLRTGSPFFGWCWPIGDSFFGEPPDWNSAQRLVCENIAARHQRTSNSPKSTRRIMERPKISLKFRYAGFGQKCEISSARLHFGTDYRTPAAVEEAVIKHTKQHEG